MKIAIASGKGGTGKTMVTAALAACWGCPPVCVDLDVEEPNLHLFLHPEIEQRRPALMEVPQVDETRCDYCRRCAEICQFKAISVLPGAVMVFQEMCHGCGGCIAVCPRDALTPASRPLGEVSRGKAGDSVFLMGKLRVGEAMSPPLIREVMEELRRSERFGPETDVLMDSPPGVSCPAVSAVIESDAILLVTEPTPFGAFDLRLAHQAFQPLGKPMGVVVNRAGLGDESVYRFCREAGLPILAEIPYLREVAEAYAAGRVISEISPKMKAIFSILAADVRGLATGDREVCHA